MDGSQPVSAAPTLDVEAVRREFPILERLIGKARLVYLDNAASTQRPLAVLDAERDFETHAYSNVHRGVHTLSQEATEAYEGARERVRRFLGAADAREVIFLRGTTEAINLVAQSYGRAEVSAGDNMVVSEMEHHSNIVPWQMLCQERGAELRVLPMDDDGELILEELDRLLDERTRIVAVGAVSNALGTINPIAEIARRVHDAGAVLVVDGAQAVPHQQVDVQAMGADFFAFSAHKVYGPSGVGALWGRRELLEAMPPWQGGGSMIQSVRFDQTTYAPLPAKFEAGTPEIVGAVGLAAALDFVDRWGMEAISAHETRLLERACAQLDDLPGVRRIGNARRRASVLSFLLDGIHAHDVGTLLDRDGIAVRAGHHCAQPVMQHYGVASTTRASFGIYNTEEEVDRLVEAVRRTQEFFA
ncbi:MAG: cysteine desulfurase [Acidobacteria bacterium]|nr:MAG: cysteine desulfurase [Acidobacteriota bacterium]REJ99622.1 MAG: cysteine desulfurase [Acidobacteriota bacterium]